MMGPPLITCYSHVKHHDLISSSVSTEALVVPAELSLHPDAISILIYLPQASPPKLEMVRERKAKSGQRNIYADVNGYQYLVRNLGSRGV